LTMLASACGRPWPRCQVRPLRRSSTAASTVPARPDRYEAAAAPKESRRLAAPVGVARGEGATGERACAERARGEGAGDVALSRASAGEPFAGPAAAPGAWDGRPEPVAASPATVPAAMTAQAPSATSTTRMGARGGLDPECPGPVCLPFAPDTDVLTTPDRAPCPCALSA
jgi:hypothetical protein